MIRILCQGARICAEIATIISGSALLTFIHFPLLIVPLLIAGYFLVVPFDFKLKHFCLNFKLDIVTLKYDTDEQEMMFWSSMLFGILLIFVAWLIDSKTESDFRCP